MPTSIIEGAGAVLIVAGVAVVFWPAALIAAGGFLLLAAWSAER